MPSKANSSRLPDILVGLGARLRTTAGIRLLSLLLLVVIAGAVMMPARRSSPEGLAELGLFAGEPSVRVLVGRIEPGGQVALRGTLRAKDGIHAAPEVRILRWDGVRLGAGSIGVTPPFGVDPDAEPLLMDGRVYDGVLEGLTQGSTLCLVSRVSLESYVASVIASEMGLSFPDEALKAQAIAARSYAIHRILTRDARPWHLQSTTISQVYRGIARGRERAESLAAEVGGIVLTWDGEILDGLYSSTCGGRTRPAGEAFGGDTIPPLEGVPCGRCDDAPLFRWEADAAADVLMRRLGRTGRILAVTDQTFHGSGRLRTVTFRTTAGTIDVSAVDIRRALRPAARSTWLADVRVEKDRIHVMGRGFGHGVGLCQYGARGMAMRRASAAEILAHYYPGSRLAKAW
jgi:stage II sporulation protein D